MTRTNCRATPKQIASLLPAGVFRVSVRRCWRRIRLPASKTPILCERKRRLIPLLTVVHSIPARPGTVKPFAPEAGVAPRGEDDDDRAKRSAKLGEDVLVPWWVRLVLAPFEHTVGDESLESRNSRPRATAIAGAR